jgi:uncharacterized protein (DUF1499 family)
MSFLRWFTRNWADTDEPGDPALAPADLSLPMPETLARVEKLIRSLSGWQVEASDATAGTLRATRRTRLWRFIDDVSIRLEPVPGGTRVHARSQSRLGKGDLGQNRRNLLQLLRLLRCPLCP